MTTDRWRRVEVLYHELLARPVAERAAILATECRGDAALQAQVQALLDAPGSAGGFLATPAIDLAAQLGSPSGSHGLTGQRVGVFDVKGLIGVGGMGEVYRARDTRLGRDVAIKILPRAFNDDRDRLARFEREARVLASLNHPHIGAIYGLEDANGSTALVMELVEGDDLSQRLARGAIPIDEALAIARQIAEALEAAHEQGIIHRDLKPANIKVRRDGTVKVLDFGLARVTAAPERDGSQAPTLTIDPTREGVVMGTAAYMSPEQARGLPVDRRTDIWAFGCVLYEMLTGRVAFAGATMTDTFAAILQQEPDWTALPDALPVTIRRLLGRCLAKDLRRRLHDIADARIELEDVSQARETAVSDSHTLANRRRTRPWLLALALATVVGLGMLALVRIMSSQRVSGDRQESRTMILPPANVSTAARGTPAQHLAISPDGQRLAFAAADENGRIQLWLRPLDELEARALPGTEDANYPFWSPDSHSVAFFAQGKLKTIDVTAGHALTLCDAGSATIAMGGTWSRDGVILFANALANGPSPGGSIYRVSASGGTPTPVAPLDSTTGETDHWAPFFLPDGQHFLYLAVGPRDVQPGFRGNAPLGIYVGSLGSNERTLVLQGGSNAKYAQGHLVFLRGSTLMAQPFDLSRLELAGDASPVAENVLIGGGSGATGAFTVSDAGVLAYESGSLAGISELVWIDRSGKQLGSIGVPGYYYGLRLSPDERRLAVTRNDAGGAFDYRGAGDLWIFDVAHGAPSRFTFNGEHNTLPVWAPNGNRLAFACGDPAHYGLCVKNASGADEDHVLLKSETRRTLPTDWSPDGRFIVYQDDAFVNTPSSVWALPMVGEPKPTPLLRTGFREGDARLSPDGRWMAYSSNRDGVTQVYVRRFPTGDGQWQVSTQGGEAPRWRGDGRELFYVASDGTVNAVATDVGVTFRSEASRPLFRPRMNRFINGAVFLDYAVTADGQRFLVNAPSAVATPIVVVQDWMTAANRVK